MKPIEVVWFKKDLRTVDHQPLYHALKKGPTVGLFIFEPEWMNSAEFSFDHFRFLIECLQDLSERLQKMGVPLCVKTGPAIEVLRDLHYRHPIADLFSHEETGLLWTYQRDIDVQKWAQSQGIPWKEFRQFGVVRKLKNRDTWTGHRQRLIERDLVQTPVQSNITNPWGSEFIPFDLLKGRSLKQYAQKGGRAEALRLLHSFFTDRGLEYFRSISSPVMAFEGCSRLSPYITWGVISLSEIHQAVQNKKSRLGLEPYGRKKLWELSIKSFESRLWWHCHFIQKLESEPEIEFENFNREFDGMRESDWDESKFQAWCKGETGFPMIDACMRALHQHGWINFRMRGMLMSFATYQLWLHWKKPAIFLAKHFLDFEPGIHYSQAQMQSGVTGINTIRIYSPKKQQLDQDPKGEFVRQYLPELRGVADADLAEPHLMPPLLQMSSGFRPGVDYPEPIVDPEQSYQIAKEKIFNWRKKETVRAESKKVLKKHGSRTSAHFPKQKRT